MENQTPENTLPVPQVPSSHDIEKIRKQILEESKQFHVEDFEKVNCLEMCLYDMTYSGSHEAGAKDYTYFGSILQVMNIRYSQQIPTAAITYDARFRRYEIILNPYFFCKILTKRQERVAVMVHEISHFTHFHLPQDFVAPNQDNRVLLNVAQDLAINQVIANLPSMCMKLEMFRDKNQNPFPAGKHFNYYYELLQDDAEFNPDNKGDPSKGAKGKGQSSASSGQGDQEGEGEGEGSGQGRGDKDTQGGGSPGADGQDGKWVKAKDAFRNAKSGGFDDHSLEGEEGSAYEKLDAAKEIMKRAYNKHVRDYGTEPQGIKDLLQKIDGSIVKLDHKRILMMALKSSLPSKDRERTWHRESRRYGKEAPGSRLKRMPKINVYADTSGSISHEELNKFLKVTEGFFTNGVEKAVLKFFHTNVYGDQKIKKNFKVDYESVESGGTELTPVFEDIKKDRPDLCVIITDGYYGDIQTSAKGIPPTVFVISNEGQMDHPLKYIGKTVKIAG